MTKKQITPEIEGSIKSAMDEPLAFQTRKRRRQVMSNLYHNLSPFY